MDQRKLVFRTDVTSALFGMFNAGDIATGIDPQIGADLVASGCAVWADGDGKAQADEAARMAGKITWRTDRPSVLFEHAGGWLIGHKVLLPGVSILERFVSEVRSRMEARLWRRPSRP